MAKQDLTLRFPTGNYICKGSSCDAFDKAISTISKAASKLPAGSKGSVALQKVLNFYGGKNKNNGVSIKFGFVAHGANAQTITSDGGSPETRTTEITINMAGVKLTGSAPGTSEESETAATAAHEGQHGIDGKFFGRPVNHEESLLTERNAYTTQSYVNEGLNTTSPYGGLWYSGDQDTPVNDGLRDAAANDHAQYDVYGKKNEN